MRIHLRLLSSMSLLTSVAGFSQAPKLLHCTVLPAAPVSDADRAFAAGDPAKAEALYTAQLAASPATGYAGIVRSQLEQNKLSEALATAQHAAAALPASAATQSLIGDALLRAGQVPEASTAYAKALTLDQCSPWGHLGYGRVNKLVSRQATALHEFTLAHGLAPADSEIAVAYLGILPEAQRAPVLTALLASHPVLGPATVERLTTQLALLNQHKTCIPVESPASASLDLTALWFNGKFERSWGLNVRFNDSSTSLLELDSSVSGIVLNPKDAQRAGVHPLTAASPDAPYTGIADHIRIGALAYRDCPVRVVPAPALADYNSVIGTDFFRDHLIHIDYVAKSLTLAPYPVRPGLGPNDLADKFVAPEEKDWSPVYLSGARIFVPTLINKKGPYLFLLDTGIGNSVISPSVTASLLSAGTDATLNVRGVAAALVKFVPREGGGDVNVTDIRGPNGGLLHVTRPVKLPVYRFTSNEYLDQRAISFDISPVSHDADIEASGLLGFSVLRNYFLDINYRDGLARILFDQNRRYEARQHERTDQYLEY